MKKKSRMHFNFVINFFSTNEKYFENMKMYKKTTIRMYIVFMKFKRYACVYIGKMSELHFSMNEKSNPGNDEIFEISLA